MNKKKLLGIVGSYRKTGNTEIVIKAVGERMGEDWELSMIRLPKLKILPCKGCYVCMLPDIKCNLDDDVEWILERMSEADAIIFGAPNYHFGPVGIIKMLADRALQSLDFLEKFKKIKTAVALTLGMEDYRCYSDTVLQAQIRALRLDVVSLDCFYGTHPGEVELINDLDAKAQKMADSLKPDKDVDYSAPDRCPRCMSDLFRLHKDGLECVICRAVAKYADGALEFIFFHPQFTEEGKNEHSNWGLKKKQEYDKVKDQLKAIQKKYSGGNWLWPEGSE